MNANDVLDTLNICYVKSAGGSQVLIKEHAKFKTETASQGKDFVPGSQHESPFIEI